MWRDWFERDGNLTRTKIVKSVRVLTDTLEEIEIHDPKLETLGMLDFWASKVGSKQQDK